MTTTKNWMAIWFTKSGVKQFVIVKRVDTDFTVQTIQNFGGRIDGRLSTADTCVYTPYVAELVTG